MHAFIHSASHSCTRLFTHAYIHIGVRFWFRKANSDHLHATAPLSNSGEARHIKHAGQRQAKAKSNLNQAESNEKQMQRYLEENNEIEYLSANTSYLPTRHIRMQQLSSEA